jgi:hypothetical protein
VVQSQSRQIVLETLYLAPRKKSITRNGLVEWVKVNALSLNPKTTRKSTVNILLFKYHFHYAKSGIFRKMADLKATV